MNEWKVVASNMDGICAYQVVHSLDEQDVRNGSYWGGVVKGMSLNKKEMQALAAELNTKNEPAPEHPYRNVFTLK